MRRFAWSEEKDAWLREVRGVGFEDVLFSLARGGLLDVLAHPNQVRYPGQRILVVEIDEYAWLVPFVEGRERRGDLPQDDHSESAGNAGALAAADGARGRDMDGLTQEERDILESFERG